MSTAAVWTTGDLSRHFHVPAWKLRRLIDGGAIPEASRVGGYRVVAAADLPIIERALRDAGYIGETERDGGAQ